MEAVSQNDITILTVTYGGENRILSESFVLLSKQDSFIYLPECTIAISNLTHEL